MEEKDIFSVYYDDRPDEVVDTIGKALKSFGLTIEEVNEEMQDGMQRYYIQRVEV